MSASGCRSTACEERPRRRCDRDWPTSRLRSPCPGSERAPLLWSNPASGRGKMRSFAMRIACVMLTLALLLESPLATEAGRAQQGTTAAATTTQAAPADPLPRTAALEWPEEDLSSRLMDGAHRFVEREIAETQA